MFDFWRTSALYIACIFACVSATRPLPFTPVIGPRLSSIYLHFHFCFQSAMHSRFTFTFATCVSAFYFCFLRQSLDSRVIDGWMCTLPDKAILSFRLLLLTYSLHRLFLIYLFNDASTYLVINIDCRQDILFYVCSYLVLRMLLNYLYIFSVVSSILLSYWFCLAEYFRDMWSSIFL